MEHTIDTTPDCALQQDSVAEIALQDRNPTVVRRSLELLIHEHKLEALPVGSGDRTPPPAIAP